MPKKYSLSLVEDLRKAAETYSEEIKELPRMDHLNERGKEEAIKKHKDAKKDKLLQTAKSLVPKIEEQIKHSRSFISKLEYPLLHSTDENERLRGEQQQANALEIFKIHYLGKNVESIYKALDDAIKNGRIDFASSLIDQIKNYPTLDNEQLKIKSKVLKLEKDYLEKTNLTEYNEDLQVLDYANNLVKIVDTLVTKGEEFIYLPEFGSKDFQDQMILGELETQAHITEIVAEDVDFEPYSEMFN